MSKVMAITKCAVTGDKTDAGDRIIQRPWGVYAVAARVNWTPELEVEVEARLKPADFVEPTSDAPTARRKIVTVPSESEPKDGA